MSLEGLKKGCPYGNEIAKGIGDGDNAALITRIAALETSVTALTTKLAAVLAADKTTDNGKTLQIDSNGKVALVTV